MGLRTAPKKWRDTKCARCGAEEQLTMHHIDHNPYNNSRSNIETLCEPCHKEHHRTEGIQRLSYCLRMLRKEHLARERDEELMVLLMRERKI